MNERSVHIPFHESDVVVAQQRVELGEHVRKRLPVGEIEQQLVAGHHRLVVGGVQHPIGVGAHEIAVAIHHLRFNPNAKVHTARLHVCNEWCQTLRIHLA